VQRQRSNSSAVAEIGDRLVTHNRHGTKSGGCAPFCGGAGPRLTLCRLAEAYLRTSGILINRLATIDLHQRYRQTDRHVRHRSRSTGRTVTCNNRSKMSNMHSSTNNQWVSVRHVDNL